MIASITGMTFLVVGISFVVGVFLAYSIWGVRHYRVLEAEATTFALQKRAEELRQEQAELKAKLREF